MKTVLLSALILACTFSILTAQNELLFFQTLSAAEEYDLDSGLSGSWALGDVFTSDCIGSQVVLIFTDVEEQEIDIQHDHGIKILGNPVRDALFIATRNLENLKYRLMTTNGQVLRKGKLEGGNGQYQVSLSEMPAQLYIIQFHSSEDDFLSSYKIIKQ